MADEPTTGGGSGSRVDRGVRPLAEQLRACAGGRHDAFNPFWPDEARRLMLWAADALDAADAALLENYREANVVWRCCAKHEGQPWTMQARVMQPARYACPHCECPGPNKG